MLTAFAHLLLAACRMVFKLCTIVCFFYPNPAKVKIGKHPDSGQIITLKFVGFIATGFFCTEKAA